MQEVRENCENYNRRYATNTGVVFAPFEHPCDVAAEHRTIATLSHREKYSFLQHACRKVTLGGSCISGIYLLRSNHLLQLPLRDKDLFTYTCVGMIYVGGIRTFHALDRNLCSLDCKTVPFAHSAIPAIVHIWLHSESHIASTRREQQRPGIAE